MDISAVRTLTAEDMAYVNHCIQRHLQSDVALINQLGHYILESGGKRLRPLLALLSARALQIDSPHHIELAAIIEFIHTATLLHDDVVDASNLRRGRQTANAIWGNEASVLVGDFLYSRAFQMMVTLQNMKIMDIMADATNTIAAGEVMQLLYCHNAETTQADYLAVIHRKTAKLFAAAAQGGAVLAQATPTQEQQLIQYGTHIGTAFQLIDDVLDYSASAAEMGKNIGDDLAEGKPTLPLIIALQRAEAATAELIRQAIRQGGLEHIQTIQSAIQETGALEYTTALAQQEAAQAVAALDALPESPYKNALIALAHFAVARNH